MFFLCVSQMSILTSTEAHMCTLARFFFLYHLCAAWPCEGETVINRRVFRFPTLRGACGQPLAPKQRGSPGCVHANASVTAPQLTWETELARKNGRPYKDWTDAALVCQAGEGPLLPSGHDHFLLKSAFPLSAAAYIHPEGLRFYRRTKERRQNSRRMVQRSHSARLGWCNCRNY